MRRLLSLCYGVAAYLAALGAILYAIGFVSGMLVPKTLDSGAVMSVGEAVAVDLLLLMLFTVPHSVMARQGFKRWWTRIVPPVIERSTYVLVASLALMFLFWQWRPIPTAVWQIHDAMLAMAVMELSLVGWGVVFVSTFLIDHFALFGLQQVALNMRGRVAGAQQFQSPLLYKVVRHPLYLGLVIAFWATPVMTAGHLLFAAVMTAYILVGIALEERDLIAAFGDEYRRYRARVGMLLPYRRRAS
jgi:protein-S-isoprenylcysteine O-methyltransferase Ste14